MGRIEKTVFISYRRTDEAWGLAVFQDLTHHGYDVFIDYDGIASGNFETVILENIRARAHFLVLLTPTALERCSDPEDWMRREIEAALESQRNIVPLMFEGFDFGTPAIGKQLTGKLAALRNYNGLEIPKARYFSSEMERLRNKFLNVQVKAVLHPASDSAQQVAEEQKGMAWAQFPEFARFLGDLRSARTVPHSKRMVRAQELVATYSILPMEPRIALALLLLLRDSVNISEDWKVVIDFIGKLPDELKSLAEAREQLAFARSHTGKHLEAIAELDALIQEFGPTPERFGIMGGRFKRLYKLATTPQEQVVYLNKTIEIYERGMDLDLNQYYCSSNLPRLYRARNRMGDQDRAQAVLNIVTAECDRAIRRGTSDEWLRPTLLAVAFDAGDADKAEKLCDEVVADGPALWQIDSVVHDLEGSVMQMKNTHQRRRFLLIINKLKFISRF